jgi:MFS family permease
MTSYPTADDGRNRGARLSVLRNRNFTLLWVGLVTSNSGSWMQIVAQGWLVYKLTGSAFALGVVGMAKAIPMLILPPMGGVIADRLPRLRLLKVTQSLSLLFAMAAAILVYADLITVWQLVLLSFLGGVVNAFDQPTRQAILPDLVRREDLTKAVALNSSAWQGAALFGPALAGLTLATIGVAGAFFFNALSFLAVVAALYLMRGVPEYGPSRGSNRGLTTDLVAGLDYVRSTPLIFALLATSMAVGFFGRAFQQFMPVFAKDVFHQGSFGLGLLMSMPGAGTLVGAAAIALLHDSRRKGLIFLASLFLFGVSLIALSLDRVFVVGLGLLFLTGLFQLVSGSMMSAIIQLESQPSMRGRVMSLSTVTYQGVSPFGGLLIGSVAGLVGTPAAVGISASCCAAAALVAMVLAPVIRNYGAFEAEATNEPGPKEEARPVALPSSLPREPARPLL